MSAWEGKSARDDMDSDFDIQDRRSRGARAWEGHNQAQSLKEESQERAEDEAACAREGSSMRCIP